MNAKDLKSKLLEIRDNGFIDSRRKGNTGVGYTLESRATLLMYPL